MTEQGLAAWRGRILAFEGLDGAGKSTVIGQVRAALEASGVPVFLPRSGKEHTSRPTRMIRRLTRDRRNLDLAALPELALYCAREAQLLVEQVAPARARGEAVILDRSLLTPVVLGSFGRGLPRTTCEQMASLAAAGVEPDATVILDVDPRTSRIRKRLAKVHSDAEPDPGRKGLSGSALKERVGAGYREVAALQGLALFHTERVAPDEVARRVVEHLRTGVAPQQLEAPEDARPYWEADPDASFEDALAGLPPELALYFSRGLEAGRGLRADALAAHTKMVAWAMDAEDPIRASVAESLPERALGGWVRRPLDSGEDDLRWRLRTRAPRAVARALRHLDDAQAEALRRELRDAAPGEVLESLCGRDDEPAWELRARLWKRGRVDQAALSLAHCRDARAWPLRERLLEKDPALALRSLRGLDDDRALTLLEQFADNAPKAVLRAMHGLAGPRADELRAALVETGREVIDSLGARGDAAALELRERCVERWPSTVMGSLLRVEATPRVEALWERSREHAGGDLHGKRRVQMRSEWPRRPDWRQREDDNDDNE